MRIAAFIVRVGIVGLAMTGQPISSAAEGGSRAVYKCELEGVLTFSDRPCGAQMQPHTPGTGAMSTYEAPAVTTSAPRTVSAPSRQSMPPQREERSEAKRKESCARYAAALKEIRSKMRAGYTAKEGEKLRAQQHKVRASQRDSRCS